MTSVLFHPEADAEVVAAANYYESQQEDLGKRFLSNIEDGLARIRINPLLYPLIDGDVRREFTPILWTVRKAATKEQGGLSWYQGESVTPASSRSKRSR